MCGYMIVKQANDLIDQKCLPPRAFMPGSGFVLQTFGQLRAAIVQCTAQQSDNLRTRAIAIAAAICRNKRGNLPAQRLAIDDLTLFGKLYLVQIEALFLVEKLARKHRAHGPFIDLLCPKTRERFVGLPNMFDQRHLKGRQFLTHEVA